MSKYIEATGNLAATPELREGENGAYTFARVLVTDRNHVDGAFVDGPTVAYEVAVSGADAKALVALAESSGNVRINFSGILREIPWESNGKSGFNNKVRAHNIGAALTGQTVSIELKNRSGNVDTVASDEEQF